MKKVILSVIGVMSLTVMSFTNSSKVSVVKTENGKQIMNAHLFSTEDLKTLKDLTVVGAKSTTLVNTSLYKEVANTIVYTSSAAVTSSETQEKIDIILAKY